MRAAGKEQGFTAVELLITLIIASIFLFSGYQLYVQVMRDGREAEKTAIISGILHSRVREGGENMRTIQPSGCTSSANFSSNEYIDKVGPVLFEAFVTCPHQSQTGDPIFLYHVRARATYTENNNQRVLEHASYTN